MWNEGDGVGLGVAKGLTAEQGPGEQGNKKAGSEGAKERGSENAELAELVELVAIWAFAGTNPLGVRSGTKEGR